MTVFARHRRDDTGASALEFALVVPLLVMLVFGVIGFGIIFAQQLALGNGARQGARFGVVADHTCADIVTEARNGSRTIRMSETDVDVEVRRGATQAAAEATPAACVGPSTFVPCEGSVTGDNLYVYAKHDSELVIPLSPVNAPVFPLRGLGVFRCEFS